MIISKLIMEITNLLSIIFETKWFTTLLVAFLAAWFTQRLNNNFTKKREKDNKRTETLKNFYYKIIPDIYDYFSIETDFRKGHDLKIHVRSRDVKKRIFDLISNNTIYVNYRILSKHRKVMSNKYFDDFSGFQKEVAEIELFCTVIEEYIDILKNSESADIKLEYQYACLFKIWKLAIFYCGNYGVAYSAISKNFYFDSNKLNKETLKKLKKLDSYQIGSEEHKIQFKRILENLTSTENIEIEEKNRFIDDFFNPMYEVNDSHAIAVFNNIDVDFGSLTVDLRIKYRDLILNELYNKKYYEGNSSKYSFNYTNEEFELLHNELKNAINYLKEKELVKLEADEQSIKLIITSKGEDIYEEKFLLDEYS
ncbi:hypothetical protein ADM98_14850 [Exiguobacterium sp. BMC-KP]|uniref:hypothetical protein n=1 Tax=Exiguobacterium sp. BMC-KP TaxID=1684312 RepID=UPI0006AA2907|nr:hypothetical protein [Exiguobacterium sp. BMC-KP]KOP30110.1 hypothetical protein ADM98_14850 [Exiguobacterium sp. BMC-KP]